MKATAGAMRDAEAMRRAREEAQFKAKQEAEQTAQTLVGTRVVVAAQAADEGRLFGSIGVRDIAAAIEKFTGVQVEHQHIDLRSPIKEIGLHEVRIVPHPEVEFMLTLDVIPA
jgi:large subunit ribosomal protein L9